MNDGTRAFSWLATARLAVAAGVFVGGLATGASARTILIRPDGTGDFPTIQAGIDAAANSDTVLLADGTYHGDGNRDIEYRGKAITVMSYNSIPEFCIIDCQGSLLDPHRAFHFCNGETSSSILRGVTIKNGYSSNRGGGIFCHSNLLCNSASPLIERCIITDCTSPWGAGLAAGVVLDDDPCWQTENSCPILKDCDFLNNHGIGACYLFYAGVPSIIVTDCTFSDNDDDGLVIEVWASDWSDGTHVINCTANNNSGTGIKVWQEFGIANIQNCRTHNNSENGIDLGGSESVVMFLDHGDLLGNRQSGLIVRHFVAATVRNSAIRNNGEYGIYCDSYMAARIVYSAVSENDGVGISGFRHVVVDSSAVCNNGGGGIEVRYADVSSGMQNTRVVQSTIANNRGYGVFLNGNGSAEVRAAIIAYNLGKSIVCPEGESIITQSDVYGNVGGDWVGCIAGQENAAGNLWADPRFCIGTARNFFLRSDSPCAAENNDGVQIGYSPVGCSPTTVGEVEQPGASRLYQNAPNPFNPMTTLRFDILYPVS